MISETVIVIITNKVFFIAVSRSNPPLILMYSEFDDLYLWIGPAILTILTTVHMSLSFVLLVIRYPDTILTWCNNLSCSFAKWHRKQKFLLTMEKTTECFEQNGQNETSRNIATELGIL